MNDPNTDSALYIIQNPYGPGTALVRRPHPPPTTTALDDDFDAITVDCTTVLGPRVQEGESDITSRNGDVVVRRETYHADSKEYGKYGWAMGEAESALSDLNLEIGKAPSASSKSVARRDAHGMDRTRSRQSMGEERDSKRDSRISDGGKSTGGRMNKGDGGGSRGDDSSKIETIQEQVEQNTGTTVNTWRKQVTKSGDQETQTRYEDSWEGNTTTDMGGPAPRTRRRPLDEDPQQRKVEGRSSEGRKSKGKHTQPVVGDGQPIVIGRTKSEQRRSFSNPAYARSERMYSAADLDVPLPPSRYSPSECAQADLSGTSRDNTVGDAKTASTSALDSILSSFQPPLLHIAPVLNNLGIRDEEHLRAVGRLSDEIRNREVKEVALKKGVTVVEWAMLIDRIRSL